MSSDTRLNGIPLMPDRRGYRGVSVVVDQRGDRHLWPAPKTVMDVEFLADVFNALRAVSIERIEMEPFDLSVIMKDMYSEKYEPFVKLKEGYGVK